MRSDGQHYLCCKQCGEYVNSSEAGAHRCVLAKADRRSIVRACVCLPVGAIDWRLLRKQKAVLAALILDRVTPGPLREVFEGVISMLDDIQNRAEPVLGRQGRKRGRETTDCYES
jgi:hypothetical protein